MTLGPVYQDANAFEPRFVALRTALDNATSKCAKMEKDLARLQAEEKRFMECFADGEMYASLKEAIEAGAKVQGVEIVWDE